VLSQQEDVFSLSVLNKTALNPAYNGEEFGIDTYVLYRQAFTGVSEAPTNALIGASMPVDLLQGGVGVKFNIDQIGFETKNSVYLEYAYKLDIEPELNESVKFGISLGIVQQDIDGSKFKFREQTELSTQYSKLTPSMAFNSGFGVLYSYKLFEAGLSIQNLNEPTVELGGNGNNFNYTLKRNYSIQSGIKKGISEGIVFKPYLVFNTDLSDYFYYVSAVIDFYDSVYAGVGYKSEALNIMVGLSLKYGIEFYVSYDVYMNEVGSKANSLEGGLKYILDLGRDKNKKIRVNRFL
jgi:type IX secretion system PorP/SprF family membrane protein